jgi:5-methylcytosine-specific restriction endonuclease McrA
LGPILVWFIIKTREQQKLLDRCIRFEDPEPTKEEFNREEWLKLRESIFKRDGYACLECGHDAIKHLTVHHIIPRCEGGTDDPENLETLCWRCHSKVHGFRMPWYLRKKERKKRKRRKC